MLNRQAFSMFYQPPEAEGLLLVQAGVLERAVPTSYLCNELLL